MIRNASPDSLNDHALLSQFGKLVQQQHEGNAELLRHIDAIDRRKLWARLGHSSMFGFLVTRYHMSEASAFKRIGAARTARRFPILFAMVGRGELHLSGIHRLKAHLTDENHEQVLATAKHKTTRQIEELIARLAPQPDVTSSLRKLPNPALTVPTIVAPAAVAPAAVASSLPAPAKVAPTPSAAATVAAAPAPVEATSAAVSPAPLSPRRDPDPAPLSPGRWKLQVTLDQSTYDKLKQLQDLLAHQLPNRDPAVIIQRALDMLWTEVHKHKTGITAKPRAAQAKLDPKAILEPESTPTVEQTRHVEAGVRREVWRRDDGRCGFVGEDGHRCNETRGLEFAHVHPWAKGGANTAANLGLRCQAHNALAADRDSGTSFMASKRKQPLKVREPVARYGVRGERLGDSRQEPVTCGATFSGEFARGCVTPMERLAEPASLWFAWWATATERSSGRQNTTSHTGVQHGRRQAYGERPDTGG